MQDNSTQKKAPQTAVPPHIDLLADLLALTDDAPTAPADDEIGALLEQAQACEGSAFTSWAVRTIAAELDVAGDWDRLAVVREAAYAWIASESRRERSAWAMIAAIGDEALLEYGKRMRSSDPDRRARALRQIGRFILQAERGRFEQAVLLCREECPRWALALHAFSQHPTPENARRAEEAAVERGQR